jgi:hypothetical protein
MPSFILAELLAAVVFATVGALLIRGARRRDDSAEGRDME